VKIMECVEQLNQLLDVDAPWTWIVHDPSGQSDFSDMADVVVEKQGTVKQDEADAAADAAAAP
jgi:hypothetical protein